MDEANTPTKRDERDVFGEAARDCRARAGQLLQESMSTRRRARTLDSPALELVAKALGDASEIFERAAGQAEIAMRVFAPPPPASKTIETIGVEQTGRNVAPVITNAARSLLDEPPSEPKRPWAQK